MKIPQLRNLQPILIKLSTMLTAMFQLRMMNLLELHMVQDLIPEIEA